MTQIKFGTDGWRAIIGKEYTTDNVSRVAYATAVWVKEKFQNPSIVIGHDCRFGGELFMHTVINVLCSGGVKVYYHQGIASTPMISLAANKLPTSLGVVITASHNPPSYNGYKLKSTFGGPTIPKEVEEIENLIPDSFSTEEKEIGYWVEKGLAEKVDLETMYAEHVEANFDLKAIKNSGFVYAYDAMYGAGQDIVKRLLPDVIDLHCEYNPSFMGQAPEPLDKNLQEFATLIKNSSDIEFGFAHDGDADRIGVYDSKGNFIDSHHVLLLLIHYLNKYKGMTGKVVVSFSVSSRIKKMCAAYGLECEITKIGFKYICEIMVNEDVLVGGEESGGIAVKGHVPERDGVWNALLLLEFMAKTGKSIDELIEEIYEVTGPFSFNRDDHHITNELKEKIIANCKVDAYKSFGGYEVRSIEKTDGFKYHLDNEAWVMIRASGTEPVLRVYAEANSKEEVRNILDAAKATLLK